MAIQCEYNTVYGINLPTAYVKINTFNGNKEEVNFDLLVYFDQIARDSEKPYLEQLFFRVPYSDGMSIQSLYDYLKTRPNFINPIDC